MVFGMPTSLFPALALDVFHVGAAGLGLMAAAPAAGALVGAALTGWVGRIRQPGRAVIVAVAAWGLAITAFGLSAWSFPLALFFLALAGAADVFSAVLRSAIVQLETPDEIRGRVVGVHILVVTSGPRLGDAEAAAVAAIAGPQFSVVSGGILCLVGLAEVVRRFPELRAYVYPASKPPEPVGSAVEPGGAPSCERSEAAPEAAASTQAVVASAASARAAAARPGPAPRPLPSSRGPLREQLVQLGQVGGRALALEDASAPHAPPAPRAGHLPGATARKSSSLIARPTSIRRSR